VLEPLLERRRNSRRPISLLVFDVDNLKGFNDLGGRAAGDKALAKIAGLLRSNVKSGDTVVRSNGDEFVIVLEDVDRDIAERVADRLIERVTNEPLDAAEGTLSLTVSVSVVTFPEDGTDLPALLDSARRMLASRKGL
jgi:diguanylate cyclase (GGDEF)-like protein